MGAVMRQVKNFDERNGRAEEVFSGQHKRPQPLPWRFGARIGGTEAEADQILWLQLETPTKYSPCCSAAEID